jgi:hypothetical protein
MFQNSYSLWRCLLAHMPALLVGCLATGCGDDSGVGKTYPVTGRITINKETLTAKSTVILFKPNAALGNTSPFEPVGTVDDDGNYALKTNGKKGAPGGWYTVVVTATEQPPEHPNIPQQHRPVAKSLAPAKYGLEKTSDLKVEVVEKPAAGAYDLALTE